MKKLLTLILALTLAVSCLAGCSDNSAAPGDTSKTPSSTSPGATPDTSPDASQGSASDTPAGEIPEIYTLMTETSLAGLKSPYIEDRTSIDKAWPKTPADKDHIVVGWAELTMSNPWFVDVANASDARAQKYGYEIKRLVCESDPVTQSEQFDTFISQGVDIIVVNPADAMAVIADIQRAVDAGIPVCTSAGILTQADCPLLTSIASSPWGVGFEAGKYIAKQYDSSKPLVAGNIIGVLGNPTSEGRVNGMVSGVIYQRLKDLGTSCTDPELYLIAYNFYQDIVTKGQAELPEANFKVVSQLVGAWTEEGGMSCAEDILAANSDVSLILAENDWMGMGAYKAIVNAGKTDAVKVGCCADGVVDAIAMVKSGEMLTTGCNSGYQQGEEVIDFIYKIFNGQLDPNNLPIASYFPEAAITGENVDQFYDPALPYFKYESMKFPSIPEYIDALLN